MRHNRERIRGAEVRIRRRSIEFTSTSPVVVFLPSKDGPTFQKQQQNQQNIMCQIVNNFKLSKMLQEIFIKLSDGVYTIAQLSLFKFAVYNALFELYTYNFYRFSVNEDEYTRRAKVALGSRD